MADCLSGLLSILAAAPGKTTFIALESREGLGARRAGGGQPRRQATEEQV